MTASDTTLAPRDASADAAGHAAVLAAGLPVGDEAALRRLLRFGGPRLLDSLAGMLLAHGPERIATMRAALAAGNAPGVELAAHSLKSSAAQLGAPALARLCFRAETSAREGDLAGVGALVDLMELGLADFAAWLARVRPTLEQP